LIRSVANNTRQDGEEIFSRGSPPKSNRTHTQLYRYAKPTSA